MGCSSDLKSRVRTVFIAQWHPVCIVVLGHNITTILDASILNDKTMDFTFFSRHHGTSHPTVGTGNVCSILKNGFAVQFDGCGSERNLEVVLSVKFMKIHVQFISTFSVTWLKRFGCYHRPFHQCLFFPFHQCFSFMAKMAKWTIESLFYISTYRLSFVCRFSKSSCPWFWYSRQDFITENHIYYFAISLCSLVS